jgi:hypothetical protein
VAVTAYRLNRPFGINRGTKRAGDQRRGGRSRSFLTNDRQTPYRGLVASSYRSDFEVPKTTPIAARSRMSGTVPGPRLTHLRAEVDGADELQQRRGEDGAYTRCCSARQCRERIMFYAIGITTNAP